MSFDTTAYESTIRSKRGCFKVSRSEPVGGLEEVVGRPKQVAWESTSEGGRLGT